MCKNTIKAVSYDAPNPEPVQTTYKPLRSRRGRGGGGSWGGKGSYLV